MTELQPGMLALIIGAYNHPENIGKIITVGERAPSSWIEVYGDGFLTDDLDSADWVLSKHLIPIPPLADPLDVSHKEELHA